MSRQVPASFTANFGFNFSIVKQAGEIFGYVLTLRGPSSVDVTGDVASMSNKVTFTGSVAIAGKYRYTLFSTDMAGARTLIDSGNVQVDEDPTAIADDSDLRTHSEIVLSNVRAVLEKRATQSQESYTINGRSLARTPIKDLMDLERIYDRRVKSESHKTPRQVLVQFRNA